MLSKNQGGTDGDRKESPCQEKTCREEDNDDKEDSSEEIRLLPLSSIHREGERGLSFPHQ